MEWLEVKINTETPGVDIVCALLMELGAGAVQIEDSAEMKSFLENDSRNWDYVDDELLNIKEDYVYIIVYLTNDNDGLFLLSKIKDALKELSAKDLDVDLGSLQVDYKIRNDEEWVNQWKKHYKPFSVGEKIIIKPEWEEYENTANKLVFTINPGHLFGTGLHQTTQLCLEALENIINDEVQLLDIGCGSGILSCVGLMLGAKNAFAVDLEPGCIKVVKENAQLNAIPLDKLTIKSGNALKDKKLITAIKENKYNIIIANIVADIIIALLPLVKSCLMEDGIFISSGIITEKLDDVLESMKDSGFNIIKVSYKDCWVSIVSELQGYE